MKYIIILLLSIGSAAQAQDSPTNIVDLNGNVTGDTAIVYRTRTDSIKGSLIMASCTGCMVQSRAAIQVTTRTNNPWSPASTIYRVRSWHRRWLFGKKIYTFHPPHPQWVLINFVPCE